jgi:hypothetical protein
LALYKAAALVASGDRSLRVTAHMLRFVGEGGGDEGGELQERQEISRVTAHMLRFVAPHMLLQQHAAATAACAWQHA